MFYGYGYSLNYLGGGALPVNTVAPAITGTAEVGSILTCSSGTWTGTAPITYAYQWKRNGVNIGGATNSTYTLVSADAGTSVKCTVTATNGLGSASADSNTVSPTFETDAQAFITAASITDPTQQSAVNQLVLDLKSASIWTKMKAVYPFVGGSAASHKWNLVNPVDSDVAFRLTFAGGWTHNSNGITGNGSTSYGNTHITPSTNLINNSTGFSFYVRNNTDAGFDTGAFEGFNKSVRYCIRLSGFSFSDQYDDTTGRLMWNPQTEGTSVGFWTATRNASNSHKIYRNGVIKASNTNSPLKSTSDNTIKLYLGAFNNGGSDALHSARNYAFASFSDGLSDTEAANLYTAVATFQTTLSRNV